MRTLFVAVVIAGFVAGFETCNAESIYPVELDGKTVNLVVPSGYCVLDKSKPDQATLIDSYYPSTSVGSVLILFFIDCDLLEKPDQDPFMTLTGDEDVGFYVYSPVWTEMLDPLMKRVSRQRYVEFNDEIWGGLSTGWLTDPLKERFVARNDPLTSAMLAFPTKLGGSDDDALYAVLRIEAFHSGEKVLFGSAHVETIVHRRSIQAVLLRRVDGAGALTGMRNDIEALLEDLLDANPDSDY